MCTHAGLATPTDWTTYLTYAVTFLGALILLTIVGGIAFACVKKLRTTNLLYRISGRRVTRVHPPSAVTALMRSSGCDSASAFAAHCGSSRLVFLAIFLLHGPCNVQRVAAQAFVPCEDSGPLGCGVQGVQPDVRESYEGTGLDWDRCNGRSYCRIGLYENCCARTESELGDRKYRPATVSIQQGFCRDGCADYGTYYGKICSNNDALCSAVKMARQNRRTLADEEAAAAEERQAQAQAEARKQQEAAEKQAAHDQEEFLEQAAMIAGAGVLGLAVLFFVCKTGCCKRRQISSGDSIYGAGGGLAGGPRTTALTDTFGINPVANEGNELPVAKVHPRQHKHGTCPILCPLLFIPGVNCCISMICRRTMEVGKMLEVGPTCPLCRKWSPKKEHAVIMGMWGQHFSPLAKKRRALLAKKSFFKPWACAIGGCIAFTVTGGGALCGCCWAACCFKIAGVEDSKEMFRWLCGCCCGYERRYPGINDWVAARDVSIGDMVQWMFDDVDLPLVPERMAAKEIAQEAFQDGITSAAKGAAKEAGKEVVQSMMGGKLHPTDIAQSCVKGLLKACCGSIVDNCYPVETKYLGEVIGFVDDDVVVRFHGRGVWRFKRDTLMEIQKCAEGAEPNANDWQEAWREERGNESLTQEERENLSTRQIAEKRFVTVKQDAVRITKRINIRPNFDNRWRAMMLTRALHVCRFCKNKSTGKQRRPQVVVRCRGMVESTAAHAALWPTGCNSVASVGLP